MHFCHVNNSLKCCFIFSLKVYRLSELIFLFILKVANIRCFILIKCSEQKKYVIMSLLVKRIRMSVESPLTHLSISRFLFRSLPNIDKCYE